MCVCYYGDASNSANWKVIGGGVETDKYESIYNECKQIIAWCESESFNHVHSDYREMINEHYKLLGKDPEWYTRRTMPTCDEVKKSCHKIMDEIDRIRECYGKLDDVGGNRELGVCVYVRSRL